MTPEVCLGSLAFLGIAFGTLIGVPAAPLYVVAGATWGPFAGPLIAFAFLLHLLLTYIISHSFLRGFIEKLLARFAPGKKLPDPVSIGPRRLVALVRFIPGIPLFVQSYFLSLCRVPFSIYLVWSLAIQLPWAWGCATAGQAFMQGQWLILVGAVLVIILLSLVARRYAQLSKSKSR